MPNVGRPPFKPTAAHRRKVEECVSCGMSEDEVCVVIGVAKETLRKHFWDELQHGRARKRAEVVALLYETARKGNVSAQKHLEQMSGVSAAAKTWEAAEGIAPKPPGQGKLGKKEQAQAAAANAGEGSEWGEDLKTDRALN